MTIYSHHRNIDVWSRCRIRSQKAHFPELNMEPAYNRMCLKVWVLEKSYQGIYVVIEGIHNICCWKVSNIVLFWSKKAHFMVEFSSVCALNNLSLLIFRHKNQIIKDLVTTLVRYILLNHCLNCATGELEYEARYYTFYSCFP